MIITMQPKINFPHCLYVAAPAIFMSPNIHVVKGATRAMNLVKKYTVGQNTQDELSPCFQV